MAAEVKAEGVLQGSFGVGVFFGASSSSSLLSLESVETFCLVVDNFLLTGAGAGAARACHSGSGTCSWCGSWWLFVTHENI